MIRSPWLLFVVVLSTALSAPITSAVAQQSRYLRCESMEDIEFYADIREVLSDEWVADWIGWNKTCYWTGPGHVRVTREYGDTVGGVEYWMETDDPEVLRVWHTYEGPRYVLREEFGGRGR